jgi:maleylacetate reductase
MHGFEHETLPQRVHFASGDAAATLRDEVGRLRASRVMVIAAPATAELAGKITAQLPVVLRWSEVVMHVPAEVALRARIAAIEHQVDLVVSIGGGSTTGLAKAIALTSGVAIVAVPTTYAGSEATTVWGLTERARKTTGADARVLPRSVVYDATLTVSLPVAMSIASGLNALAHCVDTMWGPRADPIDWDAGGGGDPRVGYRPAGSGDTAGGPSRTRAAAVRHLPRGGGVLIGRFGTAPQDLPRAGRRVGAAARPDARGSAPLRSGLQRTRGSGGRASDRGSLRRCFGDRGPAAAPSSR